MPSELGRGAQVYLGALCTLLDGAPDEHLITTIFSSDGSEESGLASHHRLAVPSGRLRRAGFDPRALLALTRHLRSLQPALIVAHGGEAMKYAVLTPTPAPLVYYRIGTSAPAARQGWRRILYRTLARRLAAVAAVSEATAAEARELLRLEGKRVTVVANGRDPSAYATSPDAGTGPELRLVFVGHLTAGKRPDRFSDLVAALRARGVAVEATMIGGGPLLGEIRAAASAHGIEVLGQRDDVAALLGTFSVLVFPSAPAGEGMPGVLIEAGMAGLAVVATDVPGASEVIEHGVTGFVVPVDDHQALVDAVGRLADDPDLRSAMGAAGRRRCAATFSLAASAARWSELIDELAPHGLSTPSPRRLRR